MIAFFWRCGLAALAVMSVTGPLAAQTASTFTDMTGNRYVYGYDQVSPINQNPYIEKWNAAGQREWRLPYSNAATADERTTLVTQNRANGEIWAVFRTDGGDSNFNTLNVSGQPFAGAPFPTYGQGGGPAVAVLGRIDPATGRLLDATYLYARLDTGRTNTLVVRELNFDATGRPVLTVNSYYRPPASGATQGSWTSYSDNQLAAKHVQGGYAVRLTLDRTLSRIESSTLLPSTYVYGASGNTEGTPPTTGGGGTGGGGTGGGGGGGTGGGDPQTPGDPEPPVEPIIEQFILSDVLPGVASFATLRSRGFAELVDRISSRGDAVFEAATLAILSQSDELRGVAIERLAGIDHAQAVRDTLALERPHSDAIAQRLRSRHLGTASAGIDLSRFAMAPDGGADAMPGSAGVMSFAPVPQARRIAADGTGIFVSGDVASMARAQRGDRIGSAVNSWSVTAGIDTALGDAVVVGLAYGHTAGRVRISHGVGDLTSRVNEVLAYASGKLGAGVYVDATGGFGAGTLHSERDVLGERAVSRGRLGTAHARVAIGQVITDVQRVFPGASPGVFVIPEISVRYDSVRLGAVTEAGSPDFNLQWRERSSRSLESEVSTTFGWRETTPAGSSAVWARVGWLWRQHVSGGGTVAAFALRPDDTFQIDTRAVDGHALQVGAGVDITTSGGVRIGASYDGTFGENAVQAHRFSARLSVAF